MALSPAAGFSEIRQDLVEAVEHYFGMPIPNLCDVERDNPGICNFVPNNAFSESKISRVLDVIEALWVSQGLNERYFDQWFSFIIQSQMKEVLFSNLLVLTKLGVSFESALRGG